jgi:isoamylase
VYGKPIEGDLLTIGSPLSSPPLIDMISTDPILRGVKVVTVDSFFISPCKS